MKKLIILLIFLILPNYSYADEYHHATAIVDMTMPIHNIILKRNDLSGMTDIDICHYTAPKIVYILSEIAPFEGILTYPEFLAIFEERYNFIIDNSYMTPNIGSGCDENIMFRVNRGRSIRDSFRMYQSNSEYQQFAQKIEQIISMQRLNLLDEIAIKKDAIDLFKRNSPSQEVEKFIESIM